MPISGNQQGLNINIRQRKEQRAIELARRPLTKLEGLENISQQ